MSPGDHAGSGSEDAQPAVTERFPVPAKESEELLKQSEQRYRHLIQSLPAALYTCDVAGNVVLYNAAAVELWGCEPGDGPDSWFASPRLYQGDGEPLPPELSPMARALREGRSIRGEKIILERPDGTRIPVLPFSDPILDGDGRVTGALHMLMDLNEISSAEAALQESEGRLQLALSSAQMGTWFWRFNEDRHVLDSSLHQLMGFSRDDSVRTLEDFLKAVHEDDRPVVQRAIERAARERGELDVQFRNVRPDGTVRWLRDRGRYVSGPLGGSPRLTGACVDVTDRVNAERALIEANRKKDEFLATLAHELRNPLAPIVNTLELLRLSGMDPSTASRGWDVVARQVNTLTRLVDDILDVARLSRGHIELRCDVVDFKSVVERAFETVQQNLTGPAYKMSVSLPAEPVWMEADPVRLEQVVTNLLNNAIKYTDPGGRIDLVLEIETRNDGDSAPEAVFRVRDTGIGIATELRSRIFDYFSRGDVSYARHRSGLGIGLSLVKTLVEMHAGTVEVNSDGPGKGSEFVVRLPMRPQPPQHPAEDDSSIHEQPSSGSLRVLVVDDNVDAAQTLAMLLRRSGYEVHIANGGATALEIAERLRPSVILMDIGMPGMDGFEVAAQLRARSEFHDTTIVALSGYGSDEDRRRSVQAGFDAHLVKPADYALITTLLTMVKPASPEQT